MDDGKTPLAASSRPTEKRSKASKRPGEGVTIAPGLPPSGAAESRDADSSSNRERSTREAMPDDFSDRPSASARPGSAKTRVVRDTVSIRSNSPATVTAPVPQSKPVAPARPPPKPVVHSNDDDEDDYADDFDEVEEDEPPAPVRKPPPKPVVTQSAPQSKSQRSQSPAQQEPAVDMDQLRRSMEKEKAEALLRKQQLELEAQAAAKSEENRSQPGEKKKAKQVQRSQDMPPTSSSSSSAPATAPAKSGDSASRVKKFTSLGLSLNTGNLLSSLDPRARRLARLLSSGVLELQEEKVNVLNIAPSTAYDQYHRMLRSPTPAIKQTGTTDAEEKRDVEVATDEIVMCDKEMQAADGDDATQFSNIMTAIKERRAMRKRGEKITDSLVEAADKIGVQRTSRHNKNNQKSADSLASVTPVLPLSAAVGASDGTGGGVSLTGFLRRASALCETMLSESEARLREAQGLDRAPESKGLFSASNVAVLGVRGAKEGKERDTESNSSNSKELSSTLVAELQSRPIVALRFSPLQPHLLVTVHGLDLDSDRGDGQNGQQSGGSTKRESKSSEKSSKGKSTSSSNEAPTSLMPKRPLLSKGLFCIWNVTSPGTPLHILAGPGQPTSACFSTAQTFLLLAGTVDGTLHLWDLREKITSSGLKKGKGKNRGAEHDAIDLSSIRKPCYSSVMSFNTGEGSSTTSAYSSTPPRSTYASSRYSTSSSSPKSISDFFSKEQHNSAIAQVEPLGDVSWTAQMSAVSQFASVDADGVVILWVTTNVAPQSADVTSIGASGKSKETKSNDVFGETDLAKSPSAAVSLVQLKVLQLNGPYSSFMDLGLSLISEHTVFSVVPNDVSTFLMSHVEGKVMKVVRFGEPKTPQSYYRPLSGTVEIAVSNPRASVIDDDGDRRGGSMSTGRKLLSPASVTCMSTRSGALSSESFAGGDVNGGSKGGEGKERDHEDSKYDDGDDQRDGEDGKKESASSDRKGKNSSSKRSATDPQARSLLLVGRSDGTVDLFRMDVCEPLQTWTLTDYADRAVPAGAGEGGHSRSPARGRDADVAYHTSPVAVVKWIPQRASAFFAADADGRCYYFDLLENPHEPVYVEAISTVRGLTNLSVDVSQCRPGGSTVYVASAFSSVGEADGGNSLKLGISVRPLREGVLRCHSSSKGERAGKSRNNGDTINIEDEELFRAMTRWVAHTQVPQVGALLTTATAEDYDDGESSRRK